MKNIHKTIISAHLIKMQNSLFGRFLFSSLFLFLIPFCTILFTYNYASRSIEKSVLQSNYSTLYQFFSNVDAVFSEMAMVDISLTSAPLVQQFAQYTSKELEHPTIDAFHLSALIDSFNQKEFENIFLSFHDFSKIYNKSNGLSINEFYQTYYKNKISYEIFLELLNASNQNYKIQVISFSMDPANPLIGVSYTQPFSHSYHAAPEITAVTTLSVSKLQSLLGNSSPRSDGILMIFNGSRQFLASSKPISEEILSFYNGKNDAQYVTIQNQKYVLQFFPSQITDCIYASAIPVSVFWAQLNNLRVISLLSILLCVLISATLAWKLAKRNYSPIAGVLKNITVSTGEVYDNQGNEIAFINNILTDSLKKIITLKKKLEVQTDNIRNAFLIHAMLGNLSDDTSDAEEDIFLQHHITLKTDCFGILLFYVEEVDQEILGNRNLKQNQQILRFIIANVAQELCAEKHQGFVVATKPRHYFCIINFSRGTEHDRQLSDMHSIAERCVSFLKQHVGISSTCVLSGIHSSLPGIQTCYQETLEAFAYRFVHGKESIIPYQKISERRFYFASVEDNKQENLLLSYIKSEHPAKGNPEIMNELLKLSGIDSLSSLEALYCFQYDLLIHFSRIIHQIGAGCLSEVNELHSSILHAETFYDVQALFAHLLDVLRQFYRDSLETFTICDEVQQYLDRNFQNPSLSNVFLGEVFHVSHSYLSRMFKVQKNTSISDYLYHLRINHAKALLEYTDNTLEDIAQDSGFLSSSTFIKVFKKSEGITPGAYRKLKLE